jgi:hypothetical protein
VTGDPESLSKAFAAWVSSGRYTDALTAVNSEKADGHVTPAPRAVYPHERVIPEDYPAVQVVVTAGTYDPDADTKDVDYEFMVVFAQVGDSEAAVTKDVLRLVRAGRDLFFRSVLDGGLGLQPIGLVREDYSQLGNHNQQAFLKAGWVTFRAKTFTE